jgi:nucleoside-diphosphate-sugar epimerase
MKVFLTGATGAIGPSTVRALLDAGHDVRAVARDPDKAARLREAGAEPVTVDLFDADTVAHATAGCDAIAHLATNVPPISRMARKSSWAMHNRLRTDATRNLLSAAKTNGIETVVKESVTFVYPDHGDGWIDESVPPDDRVTLLAPTLEGEALVTAFAGTGARGVVLRFGLFYGPASRGVDESLRLARWRASTVAGSADAYMSSIHTDDVATAAVAALGAPSGIYNVVDDHPVTRRDYLDAFAGAFDLPKLRLNPAWLLRLVAGSSAGALIASQRVANGRLRTATGWEPAYPSAQQGWAAIAETRHAGSAR